MVIFEVLAFIFSILAFIFSVVNFIELRAQKLSTHSVQYVDPWNEAMTDKTVDKVNNDIKEDNFFQEEDIL